MQRSLATMILLLMMQVVNGQITSRKEADRLLKSLNGISGLDKANSLLTLAEFYISKPGGYKSDLDSARVFINSAIALKPNDKSLQANASLLTAYISQESGQNSKALLTKAAAALLATGDKIHLAMAYIQLSKHYSGSITAQSKIKIGLMDTALTLFLQAGSVHQKTYGLQELKLCVIYGSIIDEPWKISFLNRLLSLGQQLNLPQENLLIRREIVLWRLQNGNLTVAEQELTGIINEYKTKRPLYIAELYFRLPPIYTARGKDIKAIFYALETIKSAKTGPYASNLPYYYVAMANVYLNQDKWDDAIYWTQAALALMVSRKEMKDIFICVAQVSSILILQGKAQESLLYVLNANKKYKAETINDKKHQAAALAQSYAALKRYSLAEPYFLEMARLSAIQIAVNEIKEDFRLNARLGFYYNSRKQYQKAELYLKKALAERTGVFLPSNHTVRQIYLGLFRIDSAAGNYPSAIKNLQHSQLLNDTIVSLRTIQQKEELQIAYETDQKKEDIRRLQDNEKLQLAKLENTENSRNWIIATAALLLLLLGFGYSRYLIKQRSLNQLKLQREEIDLMNSDLKNLLMQKDHLLAEKEWLVKEVHHRVKNNLHTVICLLESQAAYLENDALEAIENIQHRIFAMALIHQKLYQTDEIKSINMAVYIPDLIQYLGDSFGVSGHIHFKLKVEAIELNISSAIPLGLIINEAVTNSIKYAFPQEKKGEIMISMHNNEKETILLLADNGIGMPQNTYETQQPDSLGLELIKGLCADIKANVSFDVTQGTCITIVFERDAVSDADNFMLLMLTKEAYV